uniref:chemotaxis protein CheA n=1 Tax=Ningiella ruwaisensis TaxID=2364274 RepID=UPI00109F8DF0|nr:chemotaxis protein CheA [Ningiella ruwaisensis]
MSVDMSQFFGVFFEESQEHLDEMEHLLMELSLEAPDIEDLNSIFRAAHSIKGGSGVFGFDALTGLTHVMENILDLARKDELVITKTIVDQLLVTVDTLKNILHCYQNEEEINWAEIETGTIALEQLLKSDDVISADSSQTENGQKDAQNAQAKDEIEGFGLFEHPVTSNDDDFGFFEPLDPVSEEKAYGFYEDEEVKSESDAKTSAPVKTDDDGFGFFDDASGAHQIIPSDDNQSDLKQAPLSSTLSPSANKTASAKQAEPLKSTNANIKGAEKSAPRKVKSENKESSSIRVDTNKIDSLVNLVGELVITQSMIKIVGKEVQGETEEKLEGAIGELSRNIREIQEAVMSMRMLPMSFAFNRFPRVVRDLADKLGKDVNLVIEGGATEIDKGMIEKLVDPLTHLIRNSVDHGIEMPDKRKAAGKTAQGTVILSAQQRGGSILISITDDGAGLNRERILDKAIANGLDVAADIKDADVWNLIFEPGFSTAEAVTDVSGRGVGMDVVRRNIESIGGSVEIESHQGVGSVFRIRLPLTLAIVDGMCVSVGGQTYVIPLTNIIESMQPAKEQIKTLAKDKVLWVRGEYWPLVQMHKLMNIDNAKTNITDAIVVLVETSRKRFGILVDTLEGQQQVVIKSLEQHYKRVPGVAGATIMGDGSVAMILDIESIAAEVKTPSHQEVPIVS